MLLPLKVTNLLLNYNVLICSIALLNPLALSPLTLRAPLNPLPPSPLPLGLTPGSIYHYPRYNQISTLPNHYIPLQFTPSHMHNPFEYTPTYQSQSLTTSHNYVEEHPHQKTYIFLNLDLVEKKKQTEQLACQAVVAKHYYESKETAPRTQSILNYFIDLKKKAHKLVLAPKNLPRKTP